MVGVAAAAIIGIGPVVLPVGAEAATLVFVPPTGMSVPLPRSMTNAQNYYLDGTACAGDRTCDVVPISYPASFWPLSFLQRWCAADCQKWDVSVQDGMTKLAFATGAALAASDDDVVLYGHSQGAAVISNTMAALATTLTDDEKARLQVVLTGNIDNPAGGLWSRLGFLGQIPILDVTTGLPTPTDTGIKFTSIIMQYDGVGDAPKYWGNPLAVLNAVTGFMYLHGSTLSPDKYSPPLPCEVPNCHTPGYYPSVEEFLAALYDPANAKQDSYGNTYIVVPTPTLPIVMPLLELASKTHTTALVQPIVNLISPALRVLIDLGYDRDEAPGVYAPLSILPFSPRTNPLAVLEDLAHAVVQGFHDAVHGISVSTPNADRTAEVAALLPTREVTDVEALTEQPETSIEPTSSTGPSETAPPVADEPDSEAMEEAPVDDDTPDQTTASSTGKTDEPDADDELEADESEDTTNPGVGDDAAPASEQPAADDAADDETSTATDRDSDAGRDTTTSADAAAA
ncbi:hypothetical protein BVC93_04555 [Mycobacterium sp. MS1601]|uniref:PE-PPE domain-containing protein n=1 Tax=Mycobacterium sp. MS1601 TaxID=1936029 RepID=UPI0009797252|nr:PE-PPE domain-containing protein [Mycobacterium sp. MS1601]AQA01831.1 hypothetical protein BVC93_04555 [Mycobacterium sp. MS1601]